MRHQFSHLWSEMLRAFASASVLQVTEDPQKKGNIESGKNEKLSLRKRKCIFNLLKNLNTDDIICWKPLHDIVFLLHLWKFQRGERGHSPVSKDTPGHFSLGQKVRFSSIVWECRKILKYRNAELETEPDMSILGVFAWHSPPDSFPAASQLVCPAKTSD